MSQEFLYRSPTTPAGPGWVEDLGTQAVRLGDEAGLIMEAELGAVGISNLRFDDPTGTAGHSGDAIVGLKQFTVNELLESSNNRRIFEGYVADRRYYRGAQGVSPSLRTGAARVIDMTLADINSFLSFRVLQNVSLVNGSNTAFNRPAETDVARVTALLAVPFLSDTLFDNGLVSSLNPVNMDAVDYSGQRPADVLNDCAQQSGKNFFVYYDEVANQFSLFYDFNDSLVYPSHNASFKVSNVASDLTFDANGNVTGNVWPPLEDAVLVRDPSRVVAGVLFNNGSNSVYDYTLTTSYTYGFRDAVASATNLKTITQTKARADRYLAENSTEDDRITFTVKLPAAQVNDWKEGQYTQVKFSHLPGYESYTNVRCLCRTVAQDEMTDAFYNVKYECTPMPLPPQGAQAVYIPGAAHFARPTLPHNTTPGRMLLAFCMGTGSGYSLGAAGPAPDPYFADVSGGAAQTWNRVDFRYAKVTAGAGPIGSPDSVGVGIFWRLVRAGEMTTTPCDVSLGFANTAANIAVWLYEMDATATPGASSWWSAPATNASNDTQPGDNAANRVYSYLGVDTVAHTCWLGGTSANGQWWQVDFPVAVSSASVVLSARTSSGVPFVSPGGSSPADDNPIAEVELSDGTTYSVAAVAVDGAVTVNFGSTRTFTWLRVTFKAAGGSDAPGWSNVAITGVTPDPVQVNGSSPGPLIKANAADLTGSIVGIIGLSGVDYGNGFQVTPADGTQLTSADGHNNPTYTAHGWGPGWAYIAQNPAGGKIRANCWVYNENVAYAFPAVGVACVLNNATVLPTIPYPANQVG